MSEANAMSPPSSPSSERDLWPWFIPPFLVALVLRGVGLQAQILTGDELHSLQAALAMPVSDILRTWSFAGADYCVPLTAAYRALMDAGVVVSELSLRAPSLVAGLAAVPLLPWLASPRIGRRAAIVFAWLLAVSPMLVLYSRIARPYMPAVFAAAVAVLLFERWLRHRQPACAAGYVVSGAAAVYLHLVAAPLVLTPLLYAALRAKGRDERLALLWPALGVALAITVCLIPAQESLLEVMRAKRGGGLPSLAAWAGVLRLQLGTREWIVVALELALVARGVVVLWRTQRDFLAYLAVLVAAQLIGLMILAPDRLEERAILNRYVLVALPLFLIPIAVGLSTPWQRSGAGSATESRLPWSALAASTLVLLAAFATGPLAPGSPYWRSSFTHALSSVDFLGQGNWMPADATPRFYHSLSEAPSVGERVGERAALIEYPWENLASHAFEAYQHTHGLDVIVSGVLDRSDDERIALRNRAEPTPESFLASRARYLVIHQNLRAEASRLVSSDPHQRYWLQARKPLWEPIRRAATVMSKQLERTWGAPSYQDDMIRVWDLDLVREQARANQPEQTRANPTKPAG